MVLTELYADKLYSECPINVLFCTHSFRLYHKKLLFVLLVKHANKSFLCLHLPIQEEVCLLLTPHHLYNLFTQPQSVKQRNCEHDELCSSSCSHPLLCVVCALCVRQ